MTSITLWSDCLENLVKYNNIHHITVMQALAYSGSTVSR